MRPPLWLLAAWLLLGGWVVWLWNADLDSGLRNGGTLLASVAAAGLGALWFTFSRAFPGRLRAGVVVALVVTALVLPRFVEFDGFSGSMVPALRWQSAKQLQEPAASPPAELDLTPTPDDFAGFLGSDRDAYVPHVTLETDWETHPPVELWRQPIGEGWSSFAIVNRVAVTLEQRGDVEAVTAYALDTGELLWMYSAPGRFENLLGDDGPRSTPTIAAGRVVALGAHGNLWCLDGRDGSLLWERDLLEDYGIAPEDEARLVEYGRSNSPLVLGEEVIVPVGEGTRRQAGLAAFSLETGELLWEGPPRAISYASPSLVELAGVPQILTVNQKTISGHSPDDGTLLWEVEWSSPNVSVSQAVAIAPDRLFASKGYGVGSALLRLVPDAAGKLVPRVVWRERRTLRTKFTNVVVSGDHVYGLSDGTLECADLATGESRWKEGRYGHGQILRVGEHLLVLSEEGEVLLHDLSPEAPRVLARFQALDDKTWGNPALYGDILLVRNAAEAAAFRLATVPARD